MNDRKAGKPVFFPVRYADDCVILLGGSREDAYREMESLAGYLKETAKLELSREKTCITPIEKGFEFLGHRVRLKRDTRYGYVPRIEIPKAKVLDIRYRIKQLTAQRTVTWSLARLLRMMNPLPRGWGNFYRFCLGAKRILVSIDWYVGERLWRWMRKKYPKANMGTPDEVYWSTLPGKKGCNMKRGRPPLKTGQILSMISRPSLSSSTFSPPLWPV